MNCSCILSGKGMVTPGAVWNNCFSSLRFAKLYHKNRKNPIVFKQLDSFYKMVPVAGLEPARYRYRWILSPLRLPIPSHRHFYAIADESIWTNRLIYYILRNQKNQVFFLINFIFSYFCVFIILKRREDVFFFRYLVLLSLVI